MARALALAALSLLCFAIGCGRDRGPITVGSKNFLEQVLLGEIAAQHLEHRLGVRVARKLNLGGTLLAHAALVKGDIDLYPEYLGTAATAVLDLPASSNAEALLAQVREQYDKRFQLRWLDPLGFNNTFAMVIRTADADHLKIHSLSEAARSPSGWMLGVGYEFQQRPDGLPGMQRTYHLPLQGKPKVMDLGLLYRALEQGDVNMIAANSTDGLLLSLPVTILEDDRGSFPPYHAAFVVRNEAVSRDLQLLAALQELSGTLTDDTMRRLNREVIAQHGSVQGVATEFLRSHHLLDAGTRS